MEPETTEYALNYDDDDIIDTTKTDDPVEAINNVFAVFAEKNQLFVIPNSFMVTTLVKGSYKNKPTRAGEEIMLSAVKRGKRKDHIFIFEAPEQAEKTKYEISLDDAVNHLPGFEDYLIEALSSTETNIHTAMDSFTKSFKDKKRQALIEIRKEQKRVALEMLEAEEKKRKIQMMKNELWGAF